MADMDGTSQGVGYVGRAVSVLPADDSQSCAVWGRIAVPSETKERLLNHALLSLGLRQAGMSHVGLPLHGFFMLAGPPGVGKTSLARSLGSQVHVALAGRLGPVRRMEVNLHLLTSELLGRTQRNILQVLQEEVPAAAGGGVLIVVLDEIEVLGVARDRASPEINPADVGRGTAALLGGLDWVAQNVPGAITVGTTNLPDMLDAAVKSRADLWLDLPLPSGDAIIEILRDSLMELASIYPSCSALLDSDTLACVAALLEGCDARQVRKFVADALAYQRQTALDPATMTTEMLSAAARRLSGRRRQPSARSGQRSTSPAGAPLEMESH